MGGEVLARKQFSDDILLVLATLFYRRTPLKGRTRFQKTVFVLKEEYDVPFTFKFRPYYYGPYSEDLADLVFTLTAMKFLDEIPQKMSRDIVRYNYRLTKKGREYFKVFKQSAKEGTLEAIERLEESIPQINRMGTGNLISTAKTLMNENC